MDPLAESQDKKATKRERERLHVLSIDIRVSAGVAMNGKTCFGQVSQRCISYFRTFAAPGRWPKRRRRSRDMHNVTKLLQSKGWSICLRIIAL